MSDLVLSIIIVSYNTKDLLADCICSITEHLPRDSCEIIVVDNNSNDGSREYLQAMRDIKAIYNNDNAGYSRANNMGINAAKGKYLLFLNSDTQVLQGSLDKMVDYMEKDNYTGVIGPKLISEDREIIQMSWEFFPNVFMEIIKKALSPKNIKSSGIIKKIARHLHRRTRSVSVITGASMLARAEAVRQVGMFDEEFFLYFEDTDLCKRIKGAGWKIVFLREAEVVHLLGKSVIGMSENVKKHYRASQRYFYKKHLSKLQQILLEMYLRSKGRLVIRS